MIRIPGPSWSLPILELVAGIRYLWMGWMNPLRMSKYRLTLWVGGVREFEQNTHLWSNQHHDDVIKWKHFPRYWPFVRGIHRSPVNSPHKGQWRGALMFSLICAWINGWVNNSEPGDWDTIAPIMTSLQCIYWLTFFIWSSFNEVCSWWCNSAHWFRQWFGTAQATSHYLNQRLSSLSTHICSNRSLWVIV